MPLFVPQFHRPWESMRGLIFDFLHTRTQKLEVSTNTTIHDCTAKFRFILTKRRRRCGGGDAAAAMRRQCGGAAAARWGGRPPIHLDGRSL